MPRFATPAAELPRDRWGRPLITPPEGGEPVAYTRVTTMAGTLEDTANLTAWKGRMIAAGVALAPHLRAGAVAAFNDLTDDPDNKSAKRTLDDIAKRALETANGSSAATMGTASHSFSERVDRGQDLSKIPAEFLPDLLAYRDVMAQNNIVPVAIEGFCVLDEFQVGGTYDRIVRLPEDLLTPDGQDLSKAGLDIALDLKTAAKVSSIELGSGKMSLQLSTYSRSVDYDHRDGSRGPLGSMAAINGYEVRPVSQDWAIIAHVPILQGKANLRWLDLRPAKAALDLAIEVRAFRKISTKLSSKFATAHHTPPEPPSLAEQLRAATTLDGLRGVYLANRDAWSAGLTALAADISREKGWAGQ